jgi:hypothetical protein
MGPTRSEASAPATGSILFQLSLAVNNCGFELAFRRNDPRSRAQEDYAKRRTIKLGAVTRVDMNVFCREIAGPHPGDAASGIQVDDDWNERSKHLAVGDALIE